MACTAFIMALIEMRRCIANLFYGEDIITIYLEKYMIQFSRLWVRDVKQHIHSVMIT